MIKGISLSDPYMYYKLDPGEVGPNLPVKSRESIIHVASHEAANLARMKYDAWSKGGIVVYENLHLNLIKRGSFIAASSGYSEVKVIYPNRENSHINTDDTEKIKKENTPDHNGVFRDFKTEQFVSDKKFEKIEMEVERELSKIDNLSFVNTGDHPNLMRVKQAIKSYKSLITFAKLLNKSSKKNSAIVESLVSNIEKQIKNSLNLLM